MATIQIEHLTKAFEQPKARPVLAVNDLSLEVDSGELLVLVGPSGCGKTTTLRLIAGLEEPSSGKISIGGRDVTGLSPKDRDVAMVFQQPALYPHMTAYENLAFPLKLRKTPRPEVASRVAEIAAMLEIKDCLDRKPRELSGGQKQRVALGRALVRNPALLLLDEPLSNLDLQLRSEIRRTISRLNRDTHCTMIYVTHDQSEAMMLGTRLAVMKAGAIQQMGKPLELYRDPINLFVAGFIGWPPMNLIPGIVKKTGDRSSFEHGHKAGGPVLSFAINGAGLRGMETAVDKEIILGIRPENVRIESPPGAAIFEAHLEAIEPTGPETYIRLRHGDLTFVARSTAEALRLNDTLPVRFDLQFAHLFDSKTGNKVL